MAKPEKQKKEINSVEEFNLSHSLRQDKGDLNFGVFWISKDGRLNTEWYGNYSEAADHYLHLKALGRQPGFHLRLLETEV